VPIGTVRYHTIADSSTTLLVVMLISVMHSITEISIQHCMLIEMLVSISIPCSAPTSQQQERPRSFLHGMQELRRRSCSETSDSPRLPSPGPLGPGRQSEGCVRLGTVSKGFGPKGPNPYLTVPRRTCQAVLEPFRALSTAGTAIQLCN